MRGNANSLGLCVSDVLEDVPVILEVAQRPPNPLGGRELIGPLREQADSVSDLLGVVFGEGGCRSSCGRLLASCAACSDVHDDRGDDPAGRGGVSDQGDQLRCVHIRMVAAARCIGMTVRLTNPAVARPEGCERGWCIAGGPNRNDMASK